MINTTFFQAIVGGGILTTMCGILFAAGKVVNTVETLAKRVEGIEGGLKDMRKEMNTIHKNIASIKIELADIQSKVTVLWEQRMVL